MISKDEKIILVLVGAALVAVLIFHKRGNGGDTPLPESDVPTPLDTGNMSFLTYNQPYLFASPVANVLPGSSSGIAGIPLDDYSKSCGCHK